MLSWPADEQGLAVKAEMEGQAREKMQANAAFSWCRGFLGLLLLPERF